MSLGTLLERLLVSVQADVSGFQAEMERAVNEARKSSEGISRQFTKVGNGMMTMGAGLTAGVTAPLIAMGVEAAKAATESRQALGQVEAALKSMGPAAGKTSEDLQALAHDIMMIAGVDDDEILKSVTANLLTFGNVAGEQFDRASRAAVDLSARMGTDLQSATVMIGKALNGPAEGLAALRRVGIQFTDSQEAMIKSMVAANDVAGAQKIMLSELERQFGGSAAAMADANPWMRIKVQIGDVMEQVGEVILQMLPPVINALQGMLDGWNALSPAGQQIVMVLGAVAAAAGPLLVALGAVVSAIGTLMPVVAGVSAAIGSAGLGAALGAAVVAIGPVVLAVAALVGGFMLIKDKLMPVLQEFAAQFMEVMGPRFSQIFASAKTMVTAFADVFVAAWQGPVGEVIRFAIDLLGDFAVYVVKALGPSVIQLFDIFGATVNAVFNVVTGILKTFAALLRGDWSGAWEAFKGVIGSAVSGILDILRAMFPQAMQFMANLVNGIKDWIVNKLGAVWEDAKKKIDAVKNAFFGLYDAVVGHSYIPDMVDEIGVWMGKLDANMVVPARRATDAAKREFERLRDDVASIMESLLTDAQRKARELERQISILNRGVGSGVLSRGEADEAINRLRNTEELDPIRDRPALQELKPPQVLVDFWNHNKELREREIEETQRAMQDFGQNMSGFLRDWAQNGQADWKTLLFNMIDDWRGTLKSMSEIWNIMKAGFSGGGGGIGGIIGAAVKGLGAMFGGARAMGGDVSAGRAYRVGENGPEWFTPGQNGTIHANGSGGGRTTIVHVYANDAVLAETVRGWVQGAIDHGTQAANTAFEAARTIIPTEQGRLAEGAFIR